jgi:hypothetical protein
MTRENLRNAMAGTFLLPDAELLFEQAVQAAGTAQAARNQAGPSAHGVIGPLSEAI